jgi:hypothetical protein
MILGGCTSVVRGGITHQYCLHWYNLDGFRWLYFCRLPLLPEAELLNNDLEIFDKRKFPSTELFFIDFCKLDSAVHFKWITLQYIQLTNTGWITAMLLRMILVTFHPCNIWSLWYISYSLYQNMNKSYFSLCHWKPKVSVQTLCVA